MIIKVPSSSGNSEYEVDTENITCTCPNFKYRCTHFAKDREERLCKHLVKVYNENPQLKPKILVDIEKGINNQGVDPDGKVRYPREIFDLYVTDIKAVLNSIHTIKRYEICGSYRRLAPSISDLDILIVVDKLEDWNSILDYLENIMGYQLIPNIGRGDKKASYMINGFIHVDFKNIPEESWPFALLHFTGSKNTNIEMRRRANQLGYKLNEYGLIRESNDEPITGLTTEQDIFEFLQLPYKQPWER